MGKYRNIEPAVLYDLMILMHGGNVVGVPAEQQALWLMELLEQEPEQETLDYWMEMIESGKIHGMKTKGCG